ncbi:hypothetical protein [Streptomyces sp. NPDC015125]|uniref:hypothetical protein n=1 Tax=Streptomyces sp. NPDC015125 TaxID=3364938 RepID=UPI0036FE2094
MTDLKAGKRMSVTLIPRANTELDWLAGRTQLSQVDVINRALQIMGYIERECADGGELLIRKDGEVMKVHII